MGRKISHVNTKGAELVKYRHILSRILYIEY
jgi:hypothetical protein